MVLWGQDDLRGLSVVVVSWSPYRINNGNPESANNEKRGARQDWRAEERKEPRERVKRVVTRETIGVMVN